MSSTFINSKNYLTSIAPIGIALVTNTLLLPNHSWKIITYLSTSGITASLSKAKLAKVDRTFYNCTIIAFSTLATFVGLYLGTFKLNPKIDLPPLSQNTWQKLAFFNLLGQVTFMLFIKPTNRTPKNWNDLKALTRNKLTTFNEWYVNGGFQNYSKVMQAIINYYFNCCIKYEKLPLKEVKATPINAEDMKKIARQDLESLCKFSYSFVGENNTEFCYEADHLLNDKGLVELLMFSAFKSDLLNEIPFDVKWDYYQNHQYQTHNGNPSFVEAFLKNLQLDIYLIWITLSKEDQVCLNNQFEQMKLKQYLVHPDTEQEVVRLSENEIINYYLDNLDKANISEDVKQAFIKHFKKESSSATPSTQTQKKSSHFRRLLRKKK